MILYVVKGRIILIRQLTSLYEPVEYGNINWFFWERVPKEVLENPLDWSFSLKNGFSKRQRQLTDIAKEDLKRYVSIIESIEEYNGLANTFKLRYTKNSLGQGLFDNLLMQEVYGTPSKIIEKMVQVNWYPDIESAVEAQKLRFEDARHMFVHLIEIRKVVNYLIEENEFDKIKLYIRGEFQKLNV